jgi:hypothetical protein
VWELTTGKVVRRFSDPGDPTRRITGSAGSFSPDSRILAVLTSQGIQLCDPVSGKMLRRIVQGYSSTAIFSADGRMLLLIGGDNKKLQLFEVATGRERLSCTGHKIAIHSVAISADGRLLASASGSVHDNSDNSVRVWDAATGKELRRFAGHRNLVGSVAFAPDGKTLASSSEDDTVLIWDVGSLLPDQSLPKTDLSPEALERSGPTWPEKTPAKLTKLSVDWPLHRGNLSPFYVVICSQLPLPTPGRSTSRISYAPEFCGKTAWVIPASLKVRFQVSERSRMAERPARISVGPRSPRPVISLPRDGSE